MEKDNIFRYDKVDLNNPQHMECLGSVWHDEEAKRWVNQFHFNFVDYIQELVKPFRTSNMRIITLNSIPIGKLCFVVDESTNTLYLELIVILQEFRKKGLGKAVYIDFINSLNVDEVRIEIHLGNLPSETIAHSLGFEKYEEEDGMGYYRLDAFKTKQLGGK